jgi:hypothetical protein
MSTQKLSQLEMSSHVRPFYPGVMLLVFSGLVLGIGYGVHLFGFGGWGTLALAGLSLFAAGCLWGNWRRFAWPAVALAVVTAVMCAIGLPAQLGLGNSVAVSLNLAIIVAQLVTAVLVFRAMWSGTISPQR